MWKTGGPVFLLKRKLVAGRATDHKYKVPGNADCCCGDPEPQAAPYINRNKVRKQKKNKKTTERRPSNTNNTIQATAIECLHLEHVACWKFRAQNVKLQANEALFFQVRALD